MCRDKIKDTMMKRRAVRDGGDDKVSTRDKMPK